MLQSRPRRIADAITLRRADGRSAIIADPFVPTAGVVALLRGWSGQLGVAA